MLTATKILQRIPVFNRMFPVDESDGLAEINAWPALMIATSFIWLLIAFLLCHHGVLTEPLLYLSIFFKQHRQDYYDRLQAIRDKGDWEGWLAFFLEGVATVAAEATRTARKIVNLREEVREQIATHMGSRAARAHQLLDGLLKSPVVNVKDVERMTGLSQPAANALANRLEELGILREITGRRRNRMFSFDRYLMLFEERTRRA